MRARRRLRERDRPAARALPARRRPPGRLPDDLYVDDLRPPRARSLRAIQAGPAAAALRRRLRVLVLIRVRIPVQARALMPGLTAPLAVLAPLAFRFLPPRPPRLFRPDPLLRARRPRVRAVHPQPAFHLRQPQLQPALPLPRRFQPRRQRRNLLILRLDHSPQPRHQVTLLLTGHARLIGHEPQACSTCTKSSTTAACRRVALRPREWTPAVLLERHGVVVIHTLVNGGDRVV